MGILIGYKGTASERAEAWDTLLKLRRRIQAGEAYIRLNPDKEPPDLTQTRQWLSEEFDAYVANAA